MPEGGGGVGRVYLYLPKEGVMEPATPWNHEAHLSKRKRTKKDKSGIPQMT